MVNSFNSIKKSLLSKVDRINSYQPSSGKPIVRSGLKDFNNIKSIYTRDSNQFQTDSLDNTDDNNNFSANVYNDLADKFNDLEAIQQKYNAIYNSLQKINNKESVYTNSIKLDSDDVTYDNLNSLKREVLVLDEKLKAYEVNNKIKKDNDSDSVVEVLNKNFNLLLEKINSLMASKPTESKSKDFENTLYINSLLSNQNKPDTSRDFLAIQNYFNSLSNKLDLNAYAQSNNKSNNDSSSVLKDLINYKLVKNLSLDEDRESRSNKQSSTLSNIDSRIEQLSELLLKSIQNNLGMAKSKDLDKINDNLGNLATLHENSLAINSGMIDILNKLNENTSNIENKLNIVSNELNNVNEVSFDKSEEMENNLFAINSKLDYLLNSLSNSSNKSNTNNIENVKSTDNKIAVNLPVNSIKLQPDLVKPAVDLKYSTSNKPVDIVGNMEYLQSAINKVMQNSKK